jgi:hypothetical protein
MSKLLSPGPKTTMPTAESPIDPEDAYVTLRDWWPNANDGRRISQRSLKHKTANNMAILRDYFHVVETPRFALYADDTVQVSGISPSVASMIPNISLEPTAPDIGSVSTVLDATFQSPRPKGDPVASAPPVGDKTERDKVFMYNDPMNNLYYELIKGAQQSQKNGRVEP